ncbi:MAG TPA: triose-phosphate isomerase [Candidatus Kaiserbacteria bacterium]|nr:triose-phosphate isomerase [Candidatus Kaiserbacteria bacterium]
MNKAKKLMVANWKMNPLSVKDAIRIFSGIKQTASRLSNVQTVIAPPYLYIDELSRLYKGHRISFAGQDVFWEKEGSFTGEISSQMLKNSGAEYVIVGHSERRALGESDTEVNKKVLAATKAGLIAILCIGESNRDHKNGTHLSFLTSQLEEALNDVPKSRLSNIIIAYEPIWAIGKNEEEAMKPEELYETVLFIRKIIVSLFGKSVALRIPILYGGSAESGNTEKLLTRGMVDGLLVGHASLKVDEFSNMLRIAQSV